MNILPSQRHTYIRERLKDTRFPVADLIKNTGEDKGNVSKMWNGKKPVSEAFWKKFISHYGQKAIKLPQESEIIKKLDEILAILKRKKR